MYEDTIATDVNLEKNGCRREGSKLRIVNF
jgi:hypothetical protein